MPKEREVIVKQLGDRFTAFAVRTPMRDHSGKWVREAHECSTPDAAQRVGKDGKLTWVSPGPDGGIYDMG